MDVIIVCHTEFGFIGDREVIYDKDFKSGTKEGVPNLISLADKYGAKITFAVCPEVAKYMPLKINHEIGLHIHPGFIRYGYKNFSWVAGDSYLKENCKQSVNSTVLRDYSYEEQFEMIKKGKEYLTKRFNVEPKVFVAGRWSLNNNTVKALIENGITHDCSAPAHSVSNHYDWSKLPRICMPYHPSDDNYQKKGDLPILIVPISQALFGGTANPESIAFYGLPWLKACFLEYYKQGAPLFHICLHSPSMTDAYFISAMNNFLLFVSKHRDVNFKFVSEIKEYPDKNIDSSIFPYLLTGNSNLLKSGFRKVLRIKNEGYNQQNNL